MDEKMRAATDVAGLVGYQAELKEKVNAVSRRSLDGSVVMSSEEWNGIVELVEKLLTAAPTAQAVQGGGVQNEIRNKVAGLRALLWRYDWRTSLNRSEMDVIISDIERLALTRPQPPTSKEDSGHE